MSPFEIGFLTFFSFVFLISLVVVIHELGHYWAGRMCGVHAEAFSMGFGPTLASWRDKHGTVWRIAALPLGGYVKFLGDAGAASEPDADKLEEMRRRMGPDADRCYHFKPVWQRAFVTAAGPLANFILAIVIFSGMALVFGGQQTYQPVVGVVQPGSPSDRAGFEVGDRILQINRRPVDSFGDISQALFDRGNTEVTIELERDGAIRTVQVTPERVAQQDRFGGTRNMGRIGIGPYEFAQVSRVEAGSPAEAAGLQIGDVIAAIEGQPIETFGQLNQALESGEGAMTFTIARDGSQQTLEITPVPLDEIAGIYHLGFERLGIASGIGLVQQETYNLLTAPVEGVRQVWNTVSMTASYVGRVITGQSSPEYLNGPIGIATAAGQIATVAVDDADNFAEGLGNLLRRLVFVAGFLSVGLGLVNLLPIPILDGGHLVYYAYEAVARRPLSMKAQALGFRVGLALVLGMMLVATWNDLNYLLGQIF